MKLRSILIKNEFRCAVVNNIDTDNSELVVNSEGQLV